MAKIVKLWGPIRKYTVAVGFYSRGGGLLRICSSRVGTFSRGPIRGFKVCGFSGFVKFRGI